MALLQIHNLSYSIGDRSLLQQVSFAVDRGERLGLVGRNGSGKSTLLRLVDQQIQPDEGAIQVASGISVGYLAQRPDTHAKRTVMEQALQAFATRHAAEAELQAVADQLAHADPNDPAQQARLLKRYEQLETKLESSGGYVVEHRVQSMLQALSFDDAMMHQPVDALSGGERARLALAELLLAEPDLLMLDEPTNHLDVAGCQWLEEFLAEYDGAVILVSHDRWLLDRVISRVVEVENAQLNSYHGNYSAYAEQRAVRILEQQRVYDKQQTYVRQQKQFIQRYKAGQRAKQARGRQSRLERFEQQQMIDKPIELAVANIELPEPQRCSEQVIQVEHISKSYVDRQIIDDLNVIIERGKRWGILGPNGAGKTTLARMLVGELQPDAGRVRLGTHVSLGYYRQDLTQLPEHLTPVQYLRSQLPEGSEQLARNIAGAFLFRELEQEKPIEVLSGGERSRLAIAGLVAAGHNLLLLDEPTNHLDLPSVERLEQALQNYEGTVLLITHDRQMLANVAEHLLIFEPDGIRVLYDTYEGYLRTQHTQHTQHTQQTQQTRNAPPNTSRTSSNSDKARPSSSSSKTKKSKSDRAGGALKHLNQQKLETKLETLTRQVADLDTQLADPELYRDPKKFEQVHEQRNKVAHELEQIEHEWLRRAED